MRPINVSAFAGRDSDPKAVALISDHNLTREARVRLNPFKCFKQHGLVAPRLADYLQPLGIDINVAGSTGARAAASRLDSEDVVSDRAFHQRRAAGRLHQSNNAV